MRLPVAILGFEPGEAGRAGVLPPGRGREARAPRRVGLKPPLPHDPGSAVPAPVAR
ncbi:MAG: hypothetical protein KA419_03430 [Acidobacteria bacterium]|nr:hypothetical protein [Acidobacteriota bacterium]